MNNKIQEFIHILDTEIKIPITVINGAEKGKTILVTAGIHGCEYVGIKTAMELGKEIKPEDVKGRIIIIHPVNIEGFIERSAGIVPMDKKNLLRVFPGDENGSISEKIAFVVSRDFISKADFYFDLHGGDIHEDLFPHIYYPGKADKEVMEKSIEMAKAFDVKYYIKSNTTNGTYTSAAINYKVPSILVERGCKGNCKDEEVESYKRDMLNAFSSLKVLKVEKSKRVNTPKEIYETRYIDSEENGVWISNVNAGELINKGDVLGVITDFFGNTIKTYYSELNGIVLYKNASLATKKGEALIAYGQI